MYENVIDLILDPNEGNTVEATKTCGRKASPSQNPSGDFNISS